MVRFNFVNTAINKLGSINMKERHDVYSLEGVIGIFNKYFDLHLKFERVSRRGWTPQRESMRWL